jgi:hypothetical protein
LVRVATAQAEKIFWLCAVCEVIFREPEQYYPAEAAKRYYELHDNSMENLGYRAFLAPTLNWVREHVPPGARGLDFGCGPTPVLAKLLTEQGYKMRHYDPIFQPDQGVCEGLFDFITCTEVIEHMASPIEELRLLLEKIGPHGQLMIRTSFHRGPQHFWNWHYQRDPTHICFFNARTFEYLLQALKTSGPAGFMTLDLSLAEHAIFARVAP